MKRLVALYLTVSVLDLVITLSLMDRFEGNVEANPLPAFWYDQGGACGMTAYKLAALVVIFAALGVIVGVQRRRQLCSGDRYAKGILAFACVVTTLVVVYSSLILTL